MKVKMIISTHNLFILSIIVEMLAIRTKNLLSLSNIMISTYVGKYSSLLFSLLLWSLFNHEVLAT